MPEKVIKCPECDEKLETVVEDYPMDPEDIGLSGIVIKDLKVSRCVKCSNEILHFENEGEVLKRVAVEVVSKKDLLTVEEWNWLTNYALSRTIGAPWKDPEEEA